MSENYRITIRKSEETADAFRGLAYENAFTLGSMLDQLLNAWESRSRNAELCTKLLAMKYGDQ